MLDNFQYVCVMFPYPSGDGFHVGHAYNYLVVDSYCRWLRLQGMDVFQPFGYDSFGLPAENYARKIGGDPKEITYQNIEKFRSQLKRMNTEYGELLITSDESYQKWTQWLFLKLYERGLAYKKHGTVNYCESCDTTLANEQVKNDKCDRCEGSISQKELSQWYFKITDYKSRLIKNLEQLNYPASTIKQQRDWLENLHDWCVSRQRKWGCPIPLKGETDTLDTFVDSSFYYLRYLEPSDEVFLDKTNYRPVDLYIGGPEHACMHLIYARFINMFLYDEGYVAHEEPFKKLIHQGMITKDGAKMSKSKGNCVSPDDYDPDELRMYLMFIGPYDQGGNWNDRGVVGIRRFLGRMRLWLKNSTSDESVPVWILDWKDRLNELILDFRFNIAVAEWHSLYNKHKTEKLGHEARQLLLDMLGVFAPGFKL